MGIQVVIKSNCFAKIDGEMVPLMAFKADKDGKLSSKNNVEDLPLDVAKDVVASGKGEPIDMEKFVKLVKKASSSTAH